MEGLVGWWNTVIGFNSFGTGDFLFPYRTVRTKFYLTLVGVPLLKTLICVKVKLEVMIILFTRLAYYVYGTLLCVCVCCTG